jgi:hypothetical protein
MRKQKRHLVFIVLLLCSTSIFAQEFNKWYPRESKDRFGDPDGDSQFMYVTLGEGINSIGSKSTQGVAVVYYIQLRIVGFALKDTSSFSIPLNMLFMGPETITLYLKDAAGKTYTFNGFQFNDQGGVGIKMNNNPSLVDLLRKKDTYKSVIEGDRWSCSFTFSGGMP